MAAPPGKKCWETAGVYHCVEANIEVKQVKVSSQPAAGAVRRLKREGRFSQLFLLLARLCSSCPAVRPDDRFSSRVCFINPSESRKNFKKAKKPATPNILTLGGTTATETHRGTEKFYPFKIQGVFGSLSGMQ
jgi:hypothetical protein